MTERSPRSSPSRSPNADNAPTPASFKRKISNWAVKRPQHQNWPQPTTPPNDAITILAA